MTFFLKYRPQCFKDLVGQKTVQKTLQNALKEDHPAHAYLFTGSRGTGKTSMARIFAKGLNCPHLSDGDPCNECSLCKQITQGTLVDVIEIDAASNRGIDEIRDLREKINFMPNLAPRKIYIIDEVHMLTKEAFNALLKTLEEPPDHAFFCLATTEMHKVPETILSRCQVFVFQRFSTEQLVQRLQWICEQESIQADSKSLELIAQKAEGGLRDAISLLEQVSVENQKNITPTATQESLGIASRELLENLYASILSQDQNQGLTLLKTITENGQDFRAFGHDFLNFLREKLFDDSQNILLNIRIIDEIEKALVRIKTSPIMELPFEIAIINLTIGSLTPPKTPVPETKPKEEPPAPVASPPKQDPQTPAPEKIVPPLPPTPEEEKETPLQTSSKLSTESFLQAKETIFTKAGLSVSVKTSFFHAQVHIESNNITLKVDSDFHKDILTQSENYNKLLGSCKDFFQNNQITLHIEKDQKEPLPSKTSDSPAEPTIDDFKIF